MNFILVSVEFSAVFSFVKNEFGGEIYALRNLAASNGQLF